MSRSNALPRAQQRLSRGSRNPSFQPSVVTKDTACVFAGGEGPFVAANSPAMYSRAIANIHMAMRRFTMSPPMLFLNTRRNKCAKS